jgi:hypothetical protein
MRSRYSDVWVAGLCALLAATPIDAQTRNWGVGVHAAYVEAGTLAESGDVELQPDNSASIGGNVEAWLADGWLGLRGDVWYTTAPWIIDVDGQVDGGEDTDEGQVSLEDLGDLAIWMADADVMVRILRPWPGRAVAPFVSVGGGFMRWDQDDADLEDEYELLIAETDAKIVGDSQTEPAVTGSIGTDLFWDDRVALRLEAKDYWNPNSPYLRLSRGDEDRHHEGAHNIVYSAGLTFLFGGGGVEEPGFVAVAPGPVPPPAPQAPSATERVAMCVVGESGRLETLSATRSLDDGEITVRQNGGEVAFDAAHPAVAPRYIRGASWYVASQPLVLSLDETEAKPANGDAASDLGPVDRLELVVVGSPQTKPTRALAFVGSVGGASVFAQAGDIAALRTELDVRLRVSAELRDVLADDRFADRFLQAAATLYMAVEPGRTDCMFQPVSATRTVRR